MNQKQSSHAVSLEVYTKDGKIIDGMFLPILNKSTVAIIHEYKIAVNLNAAEKQLIESTWQILANHYIQHIVNIAKQMKENILRQLLLGVLCFMWDLWSHGRL